jgi:HSP20 family molecular chaperone IbpA
VDQWRARPNTWASPLRETVDRMFEQASAPYANTSAVIGVNTGYQSLPVHVWETGEAHRAALLAPGDEQSISVTVHDDTCAVEGELKFQAPQGARDVWQECAPVEFRRSLQLGSAVDLAARRRQLCKWCAAGKHAQSGTRTAETGAGSRGQEFRTTTRVRLSHRNGLTVKAGARTVACRRPPSSLIFAELPGSRVKRMISILSAWSAWAGSLGRKPIRAKAIRRSQNRVPELLGVRLARQTTGSYLGASWFGPLPIVGERLALPVSSRLIGPASVAASGAYTG